MAEISPEVHHHSIISIENAEHYTWGEGCEAWHLVKNGQLSIIQEAMPPGVSEVGHYHSQAQQFFYILVGEAVMEMGDKQITISAGEGLHIEPGVPHRIINRSSEPVQFLVISQPESHGDRTIVTKN